MSEETKEPTGDKEEKKLTPEVESTGEQTPAGEETTQPIEEQTLEEESSDSSEQENQQDTVADSEAVESTVDETQVADSESLEETTEETGSPETSENDEEQKTEEPVAEPVVSEDQEQTEPEEGEDKADPVEVSTEASTVEDNPAESVTEEAAPADTEEEKTEQEESPGGEDDSNEQASPAMAVEDSEETTETASNEQMEEEEDDSEEEDHDLRLNEDDQKNDEDEQEDVEEEEIDYSTYTRDQLADVVDELSKQDNFKRSDRILSQVLPLFKSMARARRQEALDKFIEEGGTQDDFEYRHDEVFNRFDASVRLIRDRRSAFYKEREIRRESNHQKKLEILDKLRELIDGENASTNISPIKALQEEWRSIGAVPPQHNRTLWANYNALLDRFYHNRQILFELKDLDRKKNQIKKTELCEKAEALDNLENIKDAIIQLNELHEEYKKVGAVPRDVQEELWQRFKAASDAIYKKRKAYLEDLKGELQENLDKKKVLAKELEPFLTFDSDRINDWNAKTKEILAIQKKWDAIGGLPREHAKEINKTFWSSFKGFFSNKNAFFKKLEGVRQENLDKKEELVARANAIKDSEDWDKTAEQLKALQREWKKIGPVPEKFRNSIYARFKEACDAFFNSRRASHDKTEAQFVENQKHKEDLIKEVKERAKAGDGSPDDLEDIMTRWNAIGFVPRGAIKHVENGFNEAVDAFVDSLDISDEEKEALAMKAELNSLKKGPNSDRRLNKKEAVLRKQIQEEEDNIALWKNNLAFFANSKTADKLKAEFDEKIAKAEEDVRQLKKQLRMVRSM